MSETVDYLEMLSFPYFAHLQAQLADPIHSISWNRVALTGYIDILITAKDQIPPTGFQRKVRVLYENYPNLDKNYPLLGDLDGLTRALNRMDPEQTEQVEAIALQWHAVVQVIEKICLGLVARRHNFNEPSQLKEALQKSLFKLHAAAQLPKLGKFLEEEQEELRRLVQLKKFPAAVFQKIVYRRQFSGTFHTEKEPIRHLIENDSELQSLIDSINKTFFRLVNLINQKLPEPVRNLSTDPSRQDLSAPLDYRLVLNLYYDGNEENEYESVLFARLRKLIRVT